MIDTGDYFKADRKSDRFLHTPTHKTFPFLSSVLATPLCITLFIRNAPKDSSGKGERPQVNSSSMQRTLDR